MSQDAQTENQDATTLDQTSAAGPTGRGRRRRRIVIVTALAVAATLVAAPFAMAHRGWGKHKVVTPELLKERADRMLDRAMDKLDGTDQQRTAIDRVVDQMIPEVIQWRSEGKKLKEELKAILLAERIDRKALELVRKDALALADRASADAFDALADVAETLTAEQRAEIAEFIAKRRGRHGR